jgi:prepilin-type N-terminal cleavage/methylation domain-containing protein
MMTLRRRSSEGFSLLELLICVAIIGILMAMYMTTFGKVHRKAKQVVVGEGMRQGRIGDMADNANSQTIKFATQDECRAAFRQEVSEDQFVTRTLYAVTSDDEFEAYYFTVISEDADEELRYEYNMLVAKDKSGRTHHLVPLTGFDEGFSALPVAWEFVSTNMGDMNGTGIGGEVMWGDGHIEYLHYPGEFPMTPKVAQLGRRFMLETERD